MTTAQSPSFRLASATPVAINDHVLFVVLELKAHGLALRADALHGGWNHRYLNVTGRWSARGTESVPLISWPNINSASVAAEAASKARGRPVTVSSMGTISSKGEVAARGFSAYGVDLQGALLGYLPYTTAASRKLEERRMKMMRYASAVWMFLSESASKGTEAGLVASRDAATTLHKQYGVDADRKLTHLSRLCRPKIDPGVLLALPVFWAGAIKGDRHGNVGQSQTALFTR